jgi:HJR/Mrr/RecB family endonuclease
MMRKPTPADYRVSETDLRAAKRIRRLLVILTIAFSVIGFTVGTHLGKDAWPLIIITVPPFGPAILYHLAKTVTRLQVPAFGRVLAYEAAVERYESWWIRTQSDFWRSLSGRAFEIELANLYRRLGFAAQVTATDQDEGVDIWIVRNGHRVPVQCKAHRRPVTPGAARELYGTMQHFGVSAGILASVSGFTGGVYEYAVGKGIELVDLSAILGLQRRLE